MIDEEFTRTRRVDVFLQGSQTTHPFRSLPVSIEPTLDHFLGIGIDGAENPGEGLVGQLTLQLCLDPEATPAVIRQRQFTELLSRYLDIFFHYSSRLLHLTIVDPGISTMGPGNYFRNKPEEYSVFPFLIQEVKERSYSIPNFVMSILSICSNMSQVSP